jgi:hypothetical protein
MVGRYCCTLYDISHTRGWFRRRTDQVGPSSRDWYSTYGTMKFEFLDDGPAPVNVTFRYRVSAEPGADLVLVYPSIGSCLTVGMLAAV